MIRNTSSLTATGFPLLAVLILAAACMIGCGEKKQESYLDGYSQHYRLGIRAYEDGKFHSAAMEFEKALEFDSGNAELSLMLATIYDDCLTGENLDEVRRFKTKAIKYYDAFLANTEDGEKRERAQGWLDSCKEELAAIDAGVAPDDLNIIDSVDKQQAIEKLEIALQELSAKYAERLEKVTTLEARVDELRNENSALQGKETAQTSRPPSVAIFAWVLLGVFVLVIGALAYSLRHAPRAPVAKEASESVVKKTIPVKSIIGSYIWVESVHNRGVMDISENGDAIHVETRALSTNAKSFGDGAYEGNILEAMLTDDTGEGALMNFEFFEDGRNFIATWEDDLGHGSAVGLRNEFDEIVRPESKKAEDDE